MKPLRKILRQPCSLPLVATAKNSAARYFENNAVIKNMENVKKLKDASPFSTPGKPKVVVLGSGKLCAFAYL